MSVTSDIPVRPRHGNGAGNTKSSKNVSFAEVTDVVGESQTATPHLKYSFLSQLTLKRSDEINL